MPWPWQRNPVTQSSSNPPPAREASADPTPATVVHGDPPLAGALRFRVDDVYEITGLGGVAVGTVLEGTLTVPTDLRVEAGPHAAQGSVSLHAKSAMVHRQDVTEVRAGTVCAIVLRPVEPGSHGRAYLKSVLRKGDSLVSP